MDEVLPTITGPLQIRLKLFAERVFAELLAELNAKAKQALGRGP
jgi:hypothetical protein